MIFFRADANNTIGAGHVMRCLGIAEIAELHDDVKFYTSSCNLKDEIISYGVEPIILNSGYQNLEYELPYITKEIKRLKPKVVFVDSYYVTVDYLAELKQCCNDNGGVLVYIDDIKEFAYPCDFLINYQIYATDDLKKEYREIYTNNNVEEPKFLLGTEYIPLRNEFRDYRKNDIKKRARDILISTGGADPQHVAIELLYYIMKNFEYLQDYRFHLVVGALNADKEEIMNLSKQITNLCIYVNVLNMAKLMNYCDVAISAAGSTLYELCATQLPAITYTCADNQKSVAKTFDSIGIMKYMGDSRCNSKQEFVKELIDEVILLSNNEKLRVKISKMQNNIIRKDGAERIVKTILEYS